jgi:hypothetical protein
LVPAAVTEGGNVAEAEVPAEEEASDAPSSRPAGADAAAADGSAETAVEGPMVAEGGRLSAGVRPKGLDTPRGRTASEVVAATDEPAMEIGT